MLLEQRSIGPVLVLTPTRNLTGGKETEELVAAADQILGQATPRIVIDLKKIDWINSPGLGALVKIHIGCTKRGGWMRLASIGKRVKDLLLVTRLIRLFDTFDTLEEALAQPEVVERKEGEQDRPSDLPDPLETSLKAALPPVRE